MTQRDSNQQFVPAVENLAAAALCSHAKDRSKIALVWESVGGQRESLTFFEIERLSNRIANGLQTLGVRREERVFTLLNRTPELYAIIPAVIKLGAAAGVLFPDYGSEAIRQRLKDAGAKVLIVNQANLEKVVAICSQLPDLEQILVVGGNKVEDLCSETIKFHSFEKLIEDSVPEFSAVSVSADDTCFLIYTSGTTGLPKGVVHRHAIQERLTATAINVLNLKKDDFYWCTADPGWVTGLCYGVFAPWLLGFPILVYEGEFETGKWLDLLAAHQVTCWYTTPTLLRLLRNEVGDESPSQKFALRRIYSAGEPLNPEVIAWAERVFAAEVFDNYWQTETGTHVIANRPGVEVRRGSMGKAVEGVQVSIIDSHGREQPNDTVGDIAVRPTLRSLFKGYWNFPEATRDCFRAGWYVTRDRGRRDSDGYFWLPPATTM